MTIEPGSSSSDEAPEAGTPVADAPVEQPAEPAAEVAPPEPVVETPAQPVAEAPAEAAASEAPAPADATPAAEGEPAPEAPAAAEAAADKPKRKRPPRRRSGRSGAASAGAPSGPRPAPARVLPKTRAQLPIDDLRDASRAMLDVIGPRQAARDAFSVLGPRERQDINKLIADEDDHRPRARNIANGSLGAGRIDKAMAATILSMAPLEELWVVALDKEQAAQKLGRIREAKQREEQHAKRKAERANRADRISREDLAKATDGSVGAKVRIVMGEEKRERSKKKKAEDKKSSSVLDKLGY